MGEPARVDERTLFGIGSNTKLFTALALGLLVEDGKFAWDLPVITYGTIDQAKTRAVSPATDFSFDFQDLLLKRR
jgi:CubicO group peptidase (beta-lactamase class C family)